MTSAVAENSATTDRSANASGDAPRHRAPKAGPYDVFTDGSCSGNPGPGGWGGRIEGPDGVREVHGGAPDTTNNRMELTAAIESLKILPPGAAVRIVTDSTYVKNGITSWLTAWKRNGWKTSSRKPVKNVDLWRSLDAQCGCRKVLWKWTKGHAGHPGNERADALARRGMAPYLTEADRPASEAD